MRLCTVISLLLAAACSGKSADSPTQETSTDAAAADTTPPADVPPEVLADVAAPADVEADATADVTEDATEDVVSGLELPPGPLEVGVGRVRLPVPVGVGTAGFGQINLGGGGLKSRYADKYAASKKVYTHPSLHTVALRVAEETVVFLRADLVGMTHEARQAVVRRVLERGGPDLDQGLVMSATHTHSGPGRLVDITLWAAITDTFFPQFYVRMVDAMADSILQAIDDLEPARWASTVVTTDEFHQDRRCESPENLDGRMPLLRFDRASDGKVKAVIAMYSVHATVIGSDAATLTRDFHGAIETKLEEQFDHPVTALFFNSWSGDTSPELSDPEHTDEMPSDYRRLEATGNALAKVILDAITPLETQTEAVLYSRNAVIPLSLAALGYTADEFSWEFGAVYCGGAGDAACFGEGEPPPKSALAFCIPFDKESPGPQDTIVGVVRLGDTYIATLPGEPSTEVGQRVLASLAADTRATTGPDATFALLGYSQDYLGYSLLEEDWYRGGYETGGSLWGPKQGQYLSDRLVSYARHVIDGTPLGWEPGTRRVPKSYAPPAWEVDEATTVQVATQPKDTPASGTVTAVVHGGDPWLLAPTVTLLTEAGEPVLRKNGTPVSSDGYEFELELDVTPAYGDVKSPVTRTFAWTVRMPASRGAETTSPSLVGGKWRLEIRGETAPGVPFKLLTDVFAVTE